MTEKRVLLAAIISIIFLTWYSRAVLIQTPAVVKRVVPSGGEPKPEPVSKTPEGAGAAIPQLIDKEEVTFIESDDIRLEIGKTSGSIRQVTLKRFMDESKKNSIQFGKETPILSVLANDLPLTWFPSESGSLFRMNFKAADNENNNYHISYEIDQRNPILKIELTHDIDGTTLRNQDLELVTTWFKGDKLGDRYNRLEYIALYKKDSGKYAYKRYARQHSGDRNVPRGTTNLTLSERYFCEIIRSGGDSLDASLIPSRPETITSKILFGRDNPQEDLASASVEIYLGPRDYFYLRKAGFESAFPVGALGQIGLTMLLALNWIAGITKNYGIAVVLFSALITCVMSPFTLLGIKSMKKMQELKPRVDKIMAQHKDNAAKAQAEVFALYKENKVSPLGGCLPMVFQMPIFIALFQAISHFIELRGKSFLWISDLSLPDHLVQFPIAIPILGNYFNLLPIIMAVAMYFQTKLSQANVKLDNTNPSAAMMSGPMMPIIFGFMFYQFSSGLVLYWLTNSLISMAWYRLAK